MTCYICHVNWTLASCESENMEDNEENLLEENGKILSFANYADVKHTRNSEAWNILQWRSLMQAGKRRLSWQHKNNFGGLANSPLLYGKTGGNRMEWKIYEEWLDITLYRQMTNLIYKLSSNEEKYKIYMQLKRKDMFLEKPKVDMETAYGLHYPGEVLERIGEH